MPDATSITSVEEPIFLVEAQDQTSDQDGQSETSKDAPQTKHFSKDWILALGMLMSFVTLNTASAQLTNLAFTDPDLNFKAPWLFVLFKSLFRTLPFPLYLSVNTIVKLVRGRKLDLCRTFRRCQKVCGDDGVTFRVIMVKFFPAMFFNMFVQIFFTFGISNLTTSMSSALTPPAVATSYLMSWLFLHQKILTVKVFFVLVSFTGVALIAYGQFMTAFTTQTIIGISAMMAQDLCLSSYQMLFKKAFPKGDLGQVSFAVSGMYVLMVFIYWPVPVILYALGVETYDITKLPYGILVGAWSCTSVSSLVYGYGLVLAGGFFMGLSDLLILAANSGIDVSLRGVTISNNQVIGTVIIGVAFIMMVLPDRYVSINFRKLCGRQMKTTESRLVLELPSSESLSTMGTTVSAKKATIGSSEKDILENVELDTNFRVSS